MRSNAFEVINISRISCKRRHQCSPAFCLRSAINGVIYRRSISPTFIQKSFPHCSTHHMYWIPVKVAWVSKGRHYNVALGRRGCSTREEHDGLHHYQHLLLNASSFSAIQNRVHNIDRVILEQFIDMSWQLGRVCTINDFVSRQSEIHPRQYVFELERNRSHQTKRLFTIQDVLKKLQQCLI